VSVLISICLRLQKSFIVKKYEKIFDVEICKNATFPNLFDPFVLRYEYTTRESSSNTNIQGDTYCLAKGQ